MAVDQIEQGRSTPKLWRPTRDAGLLIGGLVVLALLIGTTSTVWINHGSSFILLRSSASGSGRNGRPTHHTPSSGAPRIPIFITCINETSSSFHTCPSAAATCPSPSAASSSYKQRPAPTTTTCPEYFRYIHSDLSPWCDTGITRVAVERARDKATFRLVVVAGRAYVEKYRPAFQTRDVFTLWGILQLLARYPGRFPDLDLMFFCDDTPVVHAAAYPDLSMAPPLFMYCKNDMNIRPWAPFLEEVEREIRRVPWLDREPYAFWKGNPDVGGLRSDLMRCNASDNGTDWNAPRQARLGRCRPEWLQRLQFGKTMHLQLQDLYARENVVGEPEVHPGLWLPDAAHRHTLPRLFLQSAVDWGNAHPVHAQRMGEEGSSFARDELSMDYVYDYMLHQLTQYARLLRYRPTVPKNATEL
ncbi:hypothetical protein C2845_PM05G21680 [Panicum miliaceum]|uniref:Glycosyl transferase CAP10 domain-containing protein n=1 Tax=Panicum miliaceum TaxID=4540 RepID=A0A3L6SZ16_PANMI|nr:hypothetical protein C2845_PM05G21680 [Panicum miliaceum]